MYKSIIDGPLVTHDLMDLQWLMDGEIDNDGWIKDRVNGWMIDRLMKDHDWRDRINISH